MFEEPKDPVAALAATEAPPAAPGQSGQPSPPPEAQPATARVGDQPPASQAAPTPPPAAAPGAPDQSTPSTAAAQPSPYIDPYDPATLSHHLAQNEAQATELIANQFFQLSPEEKEALETDVIGTVPKLLAKVFVKSQQNVLAQMGRMIPMMMQRHLEAVKRHETNEGKFYQRWSDIKPDTHGDLVRKYAAVYRQMHPDAKLEQMIEDLGPMIMMAAKIVPSVGAPAASAGRPPGLAPQGGANGRSPQPSPFVPAGAGPVSQPKAAELAPWEAMFSQPDS